MRRVNMISGRPLREHGDPTMLAVLGAYAFMTARFALVKMGGGIVQMSGSIAGNTFGRNRYGNYVRVRTKPVNPSTERQDNVRSSMSFLTNAWSATLTPAQRTAWATYAAAIAMKNRLGESIYLTGFNHYIRSNAEANTHAMTVVAAGPTVLTLPAKDVAFGVTASAVNAGITPTFTEDTEWALEVGAKLMIYMGQPRGQTRLFFNGPWRYMGSVIGLATPGAQSPGSIMAAPYTLVVGQLVTCYARIRRVDGRISEPFIASCTVGT